MKVSIHQPNYWPWLGLLHKISLSETYVMLDNVGTNKSSNQYRNLFYCDGVSKYLTLPVNYKLGTKINELEFTSNKWSQDHLHKLSNYYRKSPFFNKIFPEIESIVLSHNIVKPIDILYESTNYLLKKFNLGRINIIKSSGLSISGTKGDLVLNICKVINASYYISGKGAKEYLTEKNYQEFNVNKINIIWQEFIHPMYNQSPCYNFVEGLSALDFLFWEGEQNAATLFYKNNGKF